MSTDLKESATSSQLEVPRLFKLIIWTRFLSAIAIFASLAATLLMLLIGSQNTLKAFAVFFASESEASNLAEPGDQATLLLLESLDNFLIGLAFVYFAYGIYSLFIRQKQIEDDGMLPWLKINSIATLKKTLLEILVVFLSVSFVKGMLEYTEASILEWDVVVFPISIVAISLSLKLMNLDEES